MAMEIISVVILSIMVFQVESGNVLIFPMMSRSSLRSGTTMATLLADEGHNVAVVVPTNDKTDIQNSTKYTFIFFETSMSREKELTIFRDAALITPLNLLLGRTPSTFSDVLEQRCVGMLYDKQLLEQVVDFKPDLAIVHLFMPCIIPHLLRLGVPFLDFCSVTLTHSLCGYPHRIPAPPSYVPDEFFPVHPTSFTSRVGNTLVHLFAPHLALKVLFGGAQKVLYTFQRENGLPYADIYELRSKASLLLLHGHLTFETIRPITPKVVYIGGDQCAVPKPLDEKLKDFVETSENNHGLIVFSLGGVLNTEVLPPQFFEIFLNIFKELSMYRVVWKLKSEPLQKRKEDIPSNVMIVDWLPQQDLLGHNRTKLFISHGGIQSSFESICHGVPMLGMGVFADQHGNIKLLEKKGMALSIDDYNTMAENEVRRKIVDLLTNESYHQNAIRARTLYFDQPTTASQRLLFAVNYTIRHKGAYHLTSQTSLQLHWFQYYSLDVGLFLTLLCFVLFSASYLVLKQSMRCFKSLLMRKLKPKSQ